jgi:N-acylneuraminate cytidylyltransferase
LGRPIIEYTIEAALEAGVFDEVIVSSDSEGIREVATKAGADVFPRSPYTCGDDVPMVDCVNEVLEDNTCDFVCMAYACSPFIKAENIREALKYLVRENYDSVFPVYRAEPPERVLIRRGDWFISRYPEYDNVNSQRFPFSYHSAGQFYFCDAKMVQKHETVMLPRCWGIEAPKWEAVDIDTEEDWQRAEMLYEMMKKRVVI